MISTIFMGSPPSRNHARTISDWRGSVRGVENHFATSRPLAKAHEVRLGVRGPSAWRPARHEVPLRFAEQNLHLLPRHKIVSRYLPAGPGSDRTRSRLAPTKACCGSW